MEVLNQELMLVPFFDLSRAGLRGNTTQMFRNILVRVDVTTLPRRHTLHDSNRSRLTEMDLELC